MEISKTTLIALALWFVPAFVAAQASSSPNTACGDFGQVEKEMRKTFDGVSADLKTEAQRAQQEADDLKKRAPDKNAVVFDFRVDWKDHEMSLHLPTVTIKNQEWILKLPEVTSHDQHFIFDTPTTRMVTEVVAKIPGLKCDGFPPKCEITQKDVVATRPIIEMQRQDIVLTVPDFAMRDKKVVVGVPEFSAQLQKIVLRLPEFTLRNVKIESEKIQHDADKLTEDTNARAKARLSRAKADLAANTVPKVNAYFDCIRASMTAARKVVVDTYAIGENDFRRRIAEAQGRGATDAAKGMQTELGNLFTARDAEVAKIDAQMAATSSAQQQLLAGIADLDK